MKILVLSSQASNTGSTLRAEYIYRYMKKAGADADYVNPPFKSMPFMLDFILSMFYNFFVLMNKRYDYVFIVKPYPNTVLPARMLAVKGARIIIDIDDMDCGYRKSFLSSFIRKMQSSLVREAWLLTSHNEELIKLIKRENPQFRDRVYKLNQCVDLGIFAPARVNKKEASKIKKAYPGKTILFYMAHLNIASYLESILESVSKIQGEFIFLIAGGGPMESYYRKLSKKYGISDKVVFLGQMRREVMVNYIYASDICLVYYEKLPVNMYRASMKLREYLAMKKSVVANGVGEIKDFKKYIYMSGAGKKAFSLELSKRIKKLDKRAEKGYKVIKEDYNWEKEVKRFIAFLCKLETINSKL